MSTPTVSVIMASYNGAALIGETIESVLRQGFADFELIIVDDCSTDDTCEVIGRTRDPRLRLLSTQSNQGPVGARNLAVEHARGRYLAALDQDDLCLPGRFASQVAVLDSLPRLVAAGSAARNLMPGFGSRLRRQVSGRYPARTTPALIRFLLHVANPLVWSTMMIRGEAARRLQPFSRAEHMFAEDFDLYHRLSAMGDIARLDTPLLLYRCHAGGASQRHRARMSASATDVLTRAYTPWFGEDARRRATLMTTYLAGDTPVPDAGALAAIATILEEVQAAFLAEHALDEATRGAIEAEMSRLWWRACRAGLRAGTLSGSVARPAFAKGQSARAGDRIVGWGRAKLLSKGWGSAPNPAGA